MEYTFTGIRRFDSCLNFAKGQKMVRNIYNKILLSIKRQFPHLLPAEHLCVTRRARYVDVSPFKGAWGNGYFSFKRSEKQEISTSLGRSVFTALLFIFLTSLQGTASAQIERYWRIQWPAEAPFPEGVKQVSSDWRELADSYFKPLNTQFGKCNLRGTPEAPYLVCFDIVAVQSCEQSSGPYCTGSAVILDNVFCDGYRGWTDPDDETTPSSLTCYAYDDADDKARDEKNEGDPCVCEGNPINPTNGNKFQRERDYVSSKRLTFVRFYNSSLKRRVDPLIPISAELGSNWRHEFNKRILNPAPPNTPPDMVWSIRDDGKAFRFSLTNGNWVSDSDVTDRLQQIVDANGLTTGWKYIYGEDKVDTFDANGRLVSVQDRTAYTQTLIYSDSSTPTNIAPSAGLLIRVMDSFGQSLDFTYDAQGRIITLKDPAAQIYQYAYDSKNNLVSVTYPGQTTKQYLYESTAYTDALTGIVDENEKRFATWNYDARGRAISSEHALGAERVTLTFSTINGVPSGTTATDSSNATRTYGFQHKNWVTKANSLERTAGSGSNAASNSTSYDKNGNISSKTDFNGVTTTYTYDLARNLETKRVEASGTAQARTITTEWHPTYRLPKRIAEPKLLTVNTYDSQGNLLSRSQQATTDANGSLGFNATLVGTARIWSYTYNQYGQVLTAKGPRADVNDTTHYDYDAQGNLITVTNAAGKVTTLSNYDANGRAGRIIDPNGLITELTYNMRGWLTSELVGNELTRYEYDGVGQLTKTTKPDGSYLSYTYDDAHRLTEITDNLGNRIVYTLDAMGNRVNEQVKDPNGTLALQTSRTYDALNRLQQITGAQK